MNQLNPSMVEMPVLPQLTPFNHTFFSEKAPGMLPCKAGALMTLMKRL